MQIWKALANLYPAATPRIDYEIWDDGTGPYIAQWNLPQPQPTVAQLQAAESAYDAAESQRQADASTLRQQVVTLAQSAVGVRVDQLTAGQVRALQALLLRNAGALNADGTIKPLAQWVT
jgi:hypothetical protein